MQIINMQRSISIVIMLVDACTKCITSLFYLHNYWHKVITIRQQLSNNNAVITIILLSTWWYVKQSTVWGNLGIGKLSQCLVANKNFTDE